MRTDEDGPGVMEGFVGPPAFAATYVDEAGRRLRANPRDPDALFVRAAFLAAIGRRSEAVATLDALAKVAPRYPGLWRFKARLYRELGDSRMERLCLEAAEHVSP